MVLLINQKTHPHHHAILYNDQHRPYMSAKHISDILQMAF